MVGNLKLRVTPTTSPLIQTTCFKHGIYWTDGGNKITLVNDPFLYIENGKLYVGSDEEDFIADACVEIPVEDFLQAYGTENKDYTSLFIPEINTFIVTLKDGTRIAKSDSTIIELSKDDTL